MSFASVAAYDRFMGRFSVPLAVAFADWVGVAPPARVLDVGSGPGALTRVLADRLGARQVVAIDPTPSFIDTVRERVPGIGAQVGIAESLPFRDGEFDAALSELVVHFMTDPAAGVREMARVTRPGGTVAACVWDTQNGRAPHTVFLRTVREVAGLDAGGRRAGTHRGDLGALLADAGCNEVVETELSVSADYASFEEWWNVHALGVGSSAGQLDGLDEETIAEIQRRTRQSVGDPPIHVTATAWAARAVVSHRPSD